MTQTFGLLFIRYDIGLPTINDFQILQGSVETLFRCEMGKIITMWLQISSGIWISITMKIGRFLMELL